MRASAFSGLSKIALVVAVSGLGAACSSDIARFDENPFRSQQVASAPQRHETVASVPTTRVDRAPLTPANDFVVAQPPARQDSVERSPVESSPFGANSDPGLTTGSVAQRPGFGSSNPPTPAVRQMAMSRTGEPPANSGRGGWSAAGGTSIRANSGDTVETLSRRYGVPGSAIAQANNLSPGQSLSAGQAVVIPTYSMGLNAQTAGTAPARPAEPMRTQVEAPRQATAPRPAPRQIATVQPTRTDAATAPVPPARMNWQAGAQANNRPAAAPAPARPQAARPASHTVVMGESLTSIATKYGVTRQQLASANSVPLDRPVRIGQTLRLPGAPAATAQRDHAQRAVAQARNTPAGQRADQQFTGSIAPTAPTARQAPAERPTAPVQAQAPAPAAPAPAPAAEAPATPPARTEQAAAPAASADPQFRWPVRGRVISNFRPGSSDGIKLSVPEGTPIKAAEDGVVAYAGSELRGYGNLVLVRHSNGFVTAYAHNSDIKVRRGEQVRRGQTIASAGQTGNVNSPQLHFEIRRGATPVDPMTFLGAN
ncbi:peptidoglycan DD-metalloendopeptidase family protein [Phreatobacter stygius]|uniref:LysM peptidoglycan-binding domain-containing protein n=1 Tax=Phreatobacter stygius TaxID=1940610 RepID=A0A4D7BM22_9HYPH|nr:peptidoglycan DD-metalloendopeptidase family protein [Phreatobacter stygius]QCI68742.1 LysM peptidoglycan-binding domain-containing protein [Phreatobacter stygius]